MKETGIAEQFLSNIGIKCQKAEDINYKDIPCDFIGIDSDFWYLVEVKESVGDCERAILQILRYYNGLRWSKYNQNVPEGYRILSTHNKRIYSNRNTDLEYAKLNHKLKEPLPCGKREIRLYILYNKYSNIREFEQYHTLFKTYLDNPNCPRIDFYYLGEDKPIKL